jgi:hypothetical protein
MPSRRRFLRDTALLATTMLVPARVLSHNTTARTILGELVKRVEARERVIITCRGVDTIELKRAVITFRTRVPAEPFTVRPR